MLLTLCALLHCCDSAPTYSGRDHHVDVQIPRFEADVPIDGDLADSVWTHAARLTGFSQYAPNDGLAAADSTQVLVWYSATAIYFGIRAFELHGRPTMTLANRDQIFDDDNVQILLGTFHDGNRASMFAVNPVGVQGDGSLIEGANVAASGFIGGAGGGLGVDLNPEATGKASGALTPSRGYQYDVGDPQVGGNVRWGVSDNLTLNGTIKPDFSQVESDAGQLAFDPRQALFFPEKRPFFLEGSELFQVPQNLIYTRQIIQPVAAVKLTGTTFGTDLGLLSAVDQKFASASGTDNPIFNILRAQRSLGRASRVGLVYTDRIEGDDYNRMAEVDSRLVFKDIYGLNLQLAGSRTRVGGVTTTAPLWLTQFTVQHRVWGLRSLFAGISDNFRDASGFIGRAGIVHSYVDPSYTTYGAPGALLQRFTGDIVVDGIWQYQNFIHGRHLQDKKLHFNGNAALRGGWNVGAGYFVESFGYDSALYAAYWVKVPKAGGGDTTVQFTGQPTIVNGEYIVQIGTPQWKHFSGNGYFLQGHDENFFEWASADLLLLSVDLSYRPTERLRNTVSYFWQQVNRRTDGSLVNVGRVLRAKLEYQLSRPLFVRVVGQYIQDKTDSLRDDSRTGAPIFIQGPDSLTRAAASHSNLFHADVLLSYQPVPGTVVFAGYGSDMVDEEAFRFRGLTRTGDAFFLKLSYLFRL